MWFKVLIEDGLGRCDCRELTYAELLKEINRLLHECVVYGLAGFSVHFIEEVDYEGQSSEDLTCGQH